MHHFIKAIYLLTILCLTTLSLGFAQDNTFRAITLPDPSERVTGIYCTSATSCVIATDGSDGGSIYASDGQTITATLITGDGPYAESFDILGSIGFLGFSKVGDRLIAQTSEAGNAFISATGDITQAASWTSEKIGTADDSEFGLSQQVGFGQKDNRWVYFINRSIFESTDMPGPGAYWVDIWSPNFYIPANFAELFQADPTLCDADPGVGWSPKLTQAGYVAPDLSIIVYPAGSRNQTTTMSPGICISTDGGNLFHHVAFEGLSDDAGPLGVMCDSAEHCLAYGGLDFNPESAAIYVTKNAQQGAGSSWTKAQVPTLRENTTFRGSAFLAEHGWVVGSIDSSSPMLLESSDGGQTWSDTTASMRSLAPDTRLHTVYAFDAEHVWIGGEKGLLLVSGK
jgi:hypothetical protein